MIFFKFLHKPNHFFVWILILSLFSVSFFSFLPQKSFAATVTWDGGAGTSDWEDDLNWSGDSAPGASDDVVIDTAVTVNINAATSIQSLTLGVSGGGTASILNFDYDAIGGSPLSVSGDLTVYSGAQITHTAGNSGINGTVNISVGNNAAITGSINVDYKGYSSSEGPGQGTDSSSGGGGASHGGIGGIGVGGGAPGGVYDSLTAPTQMGSGGGKDWQTGGTGGGAVKLTVTEITTINGTITANAANAGATCSGEPGGGSGGSVYLTTGTLAGSGSISVAGSKGYKCGGAGSGNADGGGGRIAVYYSTDSSSISYTVRGGISTYSSTRTGSSGTLYKKSTSQSYGDLILDNGGGTSGNETYLRFLPLGILSTDILEFESITATGSAAFYLSSSTASTLSASTTSLTISGNGAYDAIATSTLNYGSLNWNGGNIIDSGGTFDLISQNQDLTIPENSTLAFNVATSASPSRTYNNLIISGILTHTYNLNATTATADEDLYKIDWQINNDLTIESSGSINVDYRGYPSSEGSGPGGDSVSDYFGPSGGSYGGYGGQGNYTGASPGEVYGSFVAPIYLGSGGGNGNSSGSPGGYGGGAVKLNVTGDTIISGSISANGQSGSGLCQRYSGGGSGGSIYIITSSLSGSGSLSTNGGNSSGGCFGHSSGPGGGGRIAIYYTSGSSSLTLNNKGYSGGSWIAPSGAGTIYKKDSSLTYGDLTVDNGDVGGSEEKNMGKTPIGLIINDPIEFNSITSTSSAYLYFSSTTASSISASTTNLYLGDNGLFEITASTSMTYGTFSWGGILMDSGGIFDLISENQDLTIPVGATLVYNVATSSSNVSKTYNNLTVNGTLKHGFNSSAVTASTDLIKLNWQINGDLTVASGGVISGDKRGYPESEGPGTASDSSAPGGGSYGGQGGDGSGSSAGSTYGEELNPTYLGSGGGHDTVTNRNKTGGAGGGAIILNVTGTSLIEGEITVDGENGVSCSDCAGGSGGSVNISTDVLDGSGTITAIGGTGSNGAGGGGGGRIYVLYNTNSSSISTSVLGGSGGYQAGDAGTSNIVLSNTTPDAPSSVGPAGFVSGLWRTDTTPTLEFTLSDSDVGDTLSYFIVVDDSSDFSSPIVNYVSALQAQGATSFTVGQAAGSGSYITGNESQTLSDASYYWRVSAVDNGNAFSATSTANSGDIAFKIDATAPTAGTVSLATTSATSITATISGASDGGSGLSALPYVFYNSTASTDSSLTSSSSWVSSGLTPNTEYTFYVQVLDAAGNSADTSNDSLYTLANVPSGLSALADSDTSITASWTANDNPGGTEYYVSNTTNSTNSGWITDLSYSFTGLTCGTEYTFNVKARNTDNHETSSTSNVSVSTSACAVATVADAATPGTGSRNRRSTITSVVVSYLSDLIGFSKKKDNLKEEKQKKNENQENYEEQIEEEKESENLEEQTQENEKEIFQESGSRSQESFSQKDKEFFLNSVLKDLTQNLNQTFSKLKASSSHLIEVIGKNYTETINQVSTYHDGLITVAIAPSVIAIEYSLALNGMILSLSSLGDLWLRFLSLFYGLLTSLGLRKMRRYWGTVYDSRTKQPIDPAILDLVDVQTGKVLEKAVTDLHGRFGFLDRPGKFVINVIKTHYSFPSKEIKGYADGIFDNVYHGEIIEVKNEKDVISPNIPMDPLAFDWNQEAKKKVIKNNTGFENIIFNFLRIVFWIGFIVVLSGFLLKPSIISAIFCILYLTLILVRRKLPLDHLHGKIVNFSSYKGLILEISPIQIPNVVVGRALVDQRGRFFLKAPEGEFDLKIKEISEDEKPNKVLKTLRVKVGKEKIINRNFKI